jgi:hypothetical protein
MEQAVDVGRRRIDVAATHQRETEPPALHVPSSSYDSRAARVAEAC